MAGFSVVILSAMNLERYASIVHPIYHRTEVTKKKVLAFVITICILFLCVSLASFKLGLEIMRKFSGYVFLLHFVSTIYLYTRIFLVGKAKFQKKPEPRSAAHGNLQPIGENNEAMHQGSSSGYQGSSSGNQSHSSTTAETLSDGRKEQFISQRKQSNNQEELSDNQGKQSDNQGRQSDERGKSPYNQGRHSDDQGEQLNNEGKQSNSQAEQSDSQGKQSDNLDNRTNNQGKLPKNQKRKSEKDVSKKLKLAKSCLFVVICSFIGFILPTVFQPLELNDLDEIIVDGWFTLFVLSNSTLDSVIFFWRNKVLRNEAKKVLKNIFS